MEESEVLACPLCGAPVAATAKFCAECGTALTRGHEQAQAPNEIVEAIVASRDVSGERKFVTVLFADLKGSTEVAAGLDPEDWFYALERFHAVVTASIYEFNGVIASYAGDGIAALFGAPIAHEGHAEQACWAALTLQERVAELARELEVRIGSQLGVRVGLNSGDVVVGRIGGDARVDYSAQGIAVHIAARMEQIANVGDVFVAPATAALVETRFELDEVGLREIEGHHRLRGRAPTRQGAQSSQLIRKQHPPRSISVRWSRQRVSDAQGALDELRSGFGGAVRISAPAGTGKSRLVDEFCIHARHRGNDVVRILGDVINVPGPTWIAHELCDALVEPGTGSAESDVLTKILDPSVSPLPVDPSVIRRRIVELLSALVTKRARSTDNGLVIVVEDAHAIGSASLETLAALVAAPSNASVLYVLSHRPHPEVEVLAPLTTALIELEPLSRSETELFVSQYLTGDARVPDIALLLHDRTDGNPFFIEETLRSLMETGDLERIAAVALPTRVQTVVAARIDRLNRRVRHLLNCAAVIGVEFDLATLAAVADVHPESCSRLLETLTGADLVRNAGPEQFIFHHRITQEVTYETQLRSQRSTIHARVATALANGLDANRRAAVIGDHWDRSGDADRACDWYRIGAAQAAVTDSAESYRLWQRVRTLTVAHDADSTNAALLCLAEMLVQGSRCSIGADKTFGIINEARMLAAGPSHKPLLAFVLLRAWPAVNSAGRARDASGDHS